MVTMSWTSALALDFPPIDNLHRRLVEHIANVQTCDDRAMTEQWAALVECAQALFADEDQWMHCTDFANAPHHSLEHRVVLNVLRDGIGMARAGEFDRVREMAGELAVWFAKHTQSLDAALALHMRRQPAAELTRHRTKAVRHAVLP